MGASHGRNRWFCLAHRKSGGQRKLRESSRCDGFTDGGESSVEYANVAGRETRRGKPIASEQEWKPCERCGELADASRDEWAGSHRETGPRRGSGRIGFDVGHADLSRLEGRSIAGSTAWEGRQQPGGVAGFKLPVFAPGPGAADLWREVLVRRPELRPAISQAEAESCLHDVADGVAAALVGSRTDALRGCGNGVVALQAACAFTVLDRRFE